MSSGQAIALWNTYRNLDLQPAGASIKATPGEVGGWFLANNASSVRYVKLYDKATTPTSGDTPKLTITLPANSAANQIAVAGIDFTTGIGIRGTTGVADNDTGAPSTNDLIVNVLWK